MKIEFEGESLEEFEGLVEFFSTCHVSEGGKNRRPVECFNILEELKEKGGDTEELDEEVREEMRKEMIAAMDFIESMNFRVVERDFYLSCF